MTALQSDPFTIAEQKALGRQDPFAVAEQRALAGQSPFDTGMGGTGTVSPPTIRQESTTSRLAKQFANQAILEDIEQARPTTAIARSVGTLAEAAERIGDAPNTFWGRVKALPHLWWELTRSYHSEASREPEAALRQSRGDVTFDVPPPTTTGEKVTDAAAGLAAFLARIVALRKLTPAEIPPSLQGAVLFEMENQSRGGTPGEGALMGGALQGISAIPTRTLYGEAAKVAGESAVLAGFTAAQEDADVVDILIAAAIPPALKGAGVARREFRDRLRGAKSSDEVAEVLREANFFARTHREAQQFVENASLETLARVRKRFEGRDDPEARAMVELIDLKMRGESIVQEAGSGPDVASVQSPATPDAAPEIASPTISPEPSSLPVRPQASTGTVAQALSRVVPQPERTSAPPPTQSQTADDLSSFRRADLVARAKALGIPAKGTNEALRAAIAQMESRLQAAGEQEISPQPQSQTEARPLPIEPSPSLPQRASTLPPQSEAIVSQVPQPQPITPTQEIQDATSRQETLQLQQEGPPSRETRGEADRPQGYEPAQAIERLRAGISPKDVTDVIKRNLEFSAETRSLKGRIRDAPKDIGFIAENIASPINAALQSNDPQIVAAAQSIVDHSIREQADTERQTEQDSRVYADLPRRARRRKGAAIFRFMDRELSPVDIDASRTIPEAIKPALKHFKQRDEQMRQEIIATRRIRDQNWLRGLSSAELVDQANLFNLNWSISDSARKGAPNIIDDKGTPISHAQASKIVSQRMTPDDWGRQFAHIYHAFFGTWRIRVGDKLIGSAETKAEAVSKMRAHMRGNPGVKPSDFNVSREVVMPPDIMRVSTARSNVLRQQLKDAAAISGKEATDALRGVVGQRRIRQKFWGQLLRRWGAEGFSTDFPRVWAAQVQGFNRWKYRTMMNAEVQPILEELRKTKPDWTSHLEDMAKIAWGEKQPNIVRQFDEFIQKIPIIGDRIKPMAIDRWLGGVRTALYLSHLQTGRQAVVNSLQTIQTLLPVVGERSFIDGHRVYYSSEGKHILDQYGHYTTGGKFHEGPLSRTMTKFDSFTPMGATESRNQNLTFVVAFNHAKKRLGMAEADAVKYGRLLQVLTQFSFVPANQPKFLRGPLTKTAFQYRRFLINTIGLGVNLASGRVPGQATSRVGAVGRLIGFQLMLGGLKSIWPSSLLGLIGRGGALFLLSNWLDDEFGEDVKNMVVYGLPSLVGIDLSGSIQPVQLPPGRNTAERIGNLLMGPLGTTTTRLGTDISEDKTVEERGLSEQIGRSLLSSAPTAQQVQSLVKLIDGDYTKEDRKGRLTQELSRNDLLKKMLAFRSINESEISHYADWIVELRSFYDDVADEAARKLASGDREGAIEALQRWNSLYPQAPIDGEGVVQRAQNRLRAAQTPQAVRITKESPGPVRAIAAEELRKMLQEEDSMETSDN